MRWSRSHFFCIFQIFWISNFFLPFFFPILSFFFFFNGSLTRVRWKQVILPSLILLILRTKTLPKYYTIVFSRRERVLYTLEVRSHRRLQSKDSTNLIRSKEKGTVIQWCVFGVLCVCLFLSFSFFHFFVESYGTSHTVSIKSSSALLEQVSWIKKCSVLHFQQKVEVDSKRSREHLTLPGI